LKLREDRFRLACECLADLTFTSRPGATATATGSDTGYSYSVERARREHYEAEVSALRLEEKRASLMRASDVIGAYSALVNRTRTRLLQVSRETSAELVGRDPGTIERLIDGAIREALRELRCEIGATAADE
jgi:hypothetical protein